MNLSGLWEWEKQKLAANVDLDPKHLKDTEEEDLAVYTRSKPFEIKDDLSKDHAKAAQGGKKGMLHSASVPLMTDEIAKILTIDKHNIHKQFLTPVQKLPWQGRLNRKLEYIKVPEPSKLEPEGNGKRGRRGRAKRTGGGAALGMSSSNIRIGSVGMATRPRNDDDVGDPSEKGLQVPYSGDLFGTRGDYVGGMVYRSRLDDAMKRRRHSVPSSETEQPGSSGSKQQEEEAADAEVEVQSSRSEGDETETAAEVFLTEGVAEAAAEGFDLGVDDDDLESQQRCAATMRNWSFHEENRAFMVEEGAVNALMELAEVEDKKVRTYCATALRNLSAVPGLRGRIVELSAVHSIVELCNPNDQTLSSTDINKDCVAGLCHLSCLQSEEARLVEDGAVVTLILLMGEDEELAPICSQALFNLTCVKNVYDRIERVVKAIVQLGLSAQSSSIGVKQMCVKALTNLSNIWRCHHRMVEEGVVHVIKLLHRGTDNETRRLCAGVIRNIADARAGRSELIKKNCVPVLVTLADTRHDETQHACAAALSKLVCNADNRVRVVEEGAISALSTITKAALAMPGSDTGRLCASTLLVLTFDENSKSLAVDRGAVPVLVQLAKSSDAPTRKSCILGLCALLDVAESAPYIMEQGAVSAMVQLTADGTEADRGACVGVLFNLSCSTVTGKILVEKGFLPALLNICKANAEGTRNLAAASLCNLCNNDGNLEGMVQAGVVPALVDLMYRPSTEDLAADKQEDDAEAARREAAGEPPAPGPDADAPDEGAGPGKEFKVRNFDCVHFCTMALMMLSVDKPNAAEIVEDKAVVVKLCRFATLVSRVHSLEAGRPDGSSWDIPRAAMCAVISNLTQIEAARAMLSDFQAIQSVVRLAQLGSIDASTRHRCALTFCNLSCNEAIRAKMVDEAVVVELSKLSNSYSEENQEDCSKAFCNLSCHEGTESQMVREGAVAAIMMIAMVRAVTPRTKQTCAKALLNLLTEQSLELMVEEGLVQALTSLAKLEDTQLEEYVFTEHGELGIEWVGSEVKGLRGQALAANGEVYWSYEPAVRTRAGQMEKGLKLLLVNGVKLDDYQAQTAKQQAITSADHEEHADAAPPSDGQVHLHLRGPVTLTFAGKRKHAIEETIVVCAQAFCKLTASHAGREAMASKRASLVALFSLLVRTREPETQTVCGRAIVNLLSSEDTRSAAVSAHVVRVMRQMSLVDNPETKVNCADVFFILAHYAQARERVLAEQALPHLVTLCAVRDERCAASCARALCHFAWHEETRAALTAAGALPAIVALVEDEAQYGHVVLDGCARALCYLSFRGAEGHRQRMVTSGAVRALVEIERRVTIIAAKNAKDGVKAAYGGEKGSSPEMLRRLLSLTLRCLSWATGEEPRMVEDGCVALLCRLVDAAKASGEDSECIPLNCATAFCNIAAVPALRGALMRSQPSADEGTVTSIKRLVFEIMDAAEEEESEEEDDDEEEEESEEDYEEEEEEDEAAKTGAGLTVDTAAAEDEDEDDDDDYGDDDYDDEGYDDDDFEQSAAESPKKRPKTPKKAAKEPTEEEKAAAEEAKAKAAQAAAEKKEAAAKARAEKAAEKEKAKAAKAAVKAAEKAKRAAARDARRAAAASGEVNVVAAETCWRIAATLNALAMEPANRRLMVDDQCVACLVRLAARSDCKWETRRELASALCGLSESKVGRDQVVEEEAVPVLIRLSKETDKDTVKSCSIALSNLSTAEATIGRGTVSALIDMNKKGREKPAPGSEAAGMAESKRRAGVHGKQSIPEHHPPEQAVAELENWSPSDAMPVAVAAVRTVVTTKHTAGVAGQGPKIEPPALMPQRPITNAGTVQGEDGRDPAENADPDFFGKLEITPEMMQELNQTGRPTFLVDLSE
jgi:hypothetical protein